MKRYRKVMGLAIVLVALAVAINALAFRTATITNTAKITVVKTNGAAVALDVPVDIGTGVSANVDANYLTIDITDAMQPNSVYEFAKVLSLTNNTGRIVNITSLVMTFDGGTHDGQTLDANGIHLEFALSTDNTQILGTDITQVYDPGQVFDMIITIDPNANLTDAGEDFQIVLVVGE